MQTVERRYEVQAPIILSLDSRMAAFGRSLDQLITAHPDTGQTLAAQRRFIDEINARIKALEDRDRRNQ
jgi:membrane-bound lytic murein transglycosylase B